MIVVVVEHVEAKLVGNPIKCKTKGCGHYRVSHRTVTKQKNYKIIGSNYYECMTGCGCGKYRTRIDNENK